MSDSQDMPITQKAVDLLNHLLEAEPEACDKLMNFQVAIKKSSNGFICRSTSQGHARLSVLGLINSILNEAGAPRVAACHDDGENIVRFIVNPRTQPSAVKLVDGTPAEAPPAMGG